jgi:hypothetical protein
LIARVIYNERLPGDQQFWVTRPYAWKSLLLAKALIIAAFVNLPKLISDAVIINAYGFRIGSELSGLLWSQLLLTVVFVLPVAAICTVTTGFVQLLSVTFLVGLAVVAWNLVMPAFSVGASWLGLEWIRSYCTGIVVAIAAIAMILLQYAQRNTSASRSLAAGAVILALLATAWLPWPAAFALQSHVSTQPVDSSAVRVEFGGDKKRLTRAIIDEEHGVDLHILIRITGVPPPLKLQAEGITATIEGPGGAVWRADQHPRNQLRSEGTSTWLYVRVDDSFYRKVKDSPVRIRGSLYLTLYGNERRTFIPLERRTTLHLTPGVGLCSLTRTGRRHLLSCRSVFRSRPDLVLVDFAGTGRRGQMMSFLTLSYSRWASVSYSPFPADLRLIPVTLSTRHSEIQGPVKGVMVRAIEPVAHIRRDFEITGLHLADYEVRPTPSSQS